MKSLYEMTGVEKVAALMVALGPDVASDILKHLDEDSIDRISFEIAKIESLGKEDREDLIGEFLIDLKKQKNSLTGGENKAREILNQAFGEDKAEKLYSKIELMDVDNKFDFLKDLDPDLIVTFLKQENPQTLAIVLNYLPSQKSASILSLLPPDISKTVVVKMAKMNKVSPEAVVAIASTLKEKYKNYQRSGGSIESSGGINSLVDIINHMNGEQEQNLIKSLDKSIPDLSHQIREKIFTFENILFLTNNEIRILIDEINDDRLLAIAMKGADDDIRFKIVRNLSQNRATDIIEDMNKLGAVNISEVDKARSEIVFILRELNDTGIIHLRKDGLVE